jgi:hypothetical protein
MREIGKLLRRHPQKRTLLVMPDLLCRSCGSSNVIPDAVVNDHDSSSWRPLGVTVKLAQPEQTDVLGLVTATRASMTVLLHARVCGECGAADLYADDPAALWKAYRG